ncbi:ABC bile acid [Mycena indigotica]|uniref:ABC bile acid n=1 Tax=Mycena indigotica TaxID=2126181 RepID=A0A8H6W0Q8_9AGAR|nr:ABC bile acid [Mycena indigotica]KAF7297333.1 ABC bile acid [Mycena indigotica]
MALCPDFDIFDLSNACVRSSWAAIIPSVFVLVTLATQFTFPVPQQLRPSLLALKRQFTPFLPLPEAEALAQAEDLAQGVEEDIEIDSRTPPWQHLVLSSIALLECVAWLASGAFSVGLEQLGWRAIHHFLISTTWLYAFTFSTMQATATPPYRLLALYVIHFCGGLLQANGWLTLVNLSCITVLLVTIVRMPMAIPSKSTRRDEIGRSISPEDYTSLWRWVTFSWIYPIIQRGLRVTINESDVWNLSPTFSSHPLFLAFSALPQKSLLGRLWAANSFDMSMDFLLTLLSVILSYAGPFFLKRILDAFESQSNKQVVYLYAVLIHCILLIVPQSQCDLNHFWFGRRAGTRLRSELMAAIYDKALRRVDLSGAVSNDKQEQSSPGADTGKIVNLMSSDATRISTQVINWYMIYGAPMEILVGFIMLYQLLGFSAFTGFVALILGSPLNSAFTRNNERIQKGMLKARDARMASVTELISAIKFVKFFAWEKRWVDRVFAARNIELGWLVQARVNGIGFLGLWTLTPILVSVISFTTFVLLGNELTVGKAFTAIALFGMIRQPLNIIPTFVVQILQTRLSVDRIDAFLNEPEVELKNVRSTPLQESAWARGLGFDNSSFKWNENTRDQNVETTNSETDSNFTIDGISERQFELRNLSVSFPEGKITVVTGPTASGKTALLMALLGEMTALPGGRLMMSKNPNKIDDWGHVYGFSYAAQSPWLRHQSIKDNILFGYPYDEKRYNAVIDCCALHPDLDLLEDRDDTEIGEKGVSLSGGQKARVALARAVYAKTRYVLLDDPLSAVDSHTSRVLYEKCLCGPILAHRTVVLVTHHVKLVLPAANYLVRMSNGQIETQGSVSELRAQRKLDQITHDAAVEAEREGVVEEQETSAAMGSNYNSDGGPKKVPRKFIEDEHRATGGVKRQVYKRYLQAMSYWIWGFMVLSVVGLQLLGVAEKLWIKIWGEAYQDSALEVETALPNGDSSSFRWPTAQEHPLFYISIYSAIGLVTVLVTVISSAAQMTGAYRAGQTFFNALVVGIVRAPFRFHDTTPQGRLLNRFGKDMETIDLSIATALQRVNQYLGTFLAAFITITFVAPTFIFPALFIGYCYYHLAVGYLSTGRDLRRMESNSRSPIFSDFAEVLQGLVTIRAFGAEKRFLDNIHNRIDMTTKMWYTFWMTNAWLQLNFDFLGSLAVLLAALFSIHYLSRDAGLTGLAITSALNITSSVFWTCYFWTQLELDLNSVERVSEYLELPQEPPAIIESSRPPAYWPSTTGNDALLIADNLTVKYAPDLPAVIKDASFCLRAGERIGILGRTGSGKSTLAMSILRFTDPSSGRIIIDGMSCIDITKIGVEDLRSRLTYIPQDAALFSGSLRENLDPFGEHTDAACQEVLHRVHLTTASSQPIHGVATGEHPAFSTATTEEDSKVHLSLDTPISVGGTNFSQGQRQLIAMARALLRKSAIVLLDEATSSVDFETDGKIQMTIREEFTQSLLLTIAHRLKTIIDYDRLLVLDKGRIVEFDTPHVLIRKEGGIFREMCRKSGYFEELDAAAKEASADLSR